MSLYKPCFSKEYLLEYAQVQLPSLFIQRSSEVIFCVNVPPFRITCKMLWSSRARFWSNFHKCRLDVMPLRLRAMTWAGIIKKRKGSLSHCDGGAAIGRTFSGRRASCFYIPCSTYLNLLASKLCGKTHLCDRVYIERIESDVWDGG